MGFNRDVIRRRRDEMHELGVRVRWAGRAPRLWHSVIRELQVAEELTRDNKVLTLTMCVNYGGRAELADTARSIAREVAAGRLDPDRVDERVFARHLYVPEVADADMIWRTSGEQRLSNFMLWQAAYAELVFTDVLWPDWTDSSCGRRSSCTPSATAGTGRRDFGCSRAVPRCRAPIYPELTGAPRHGLGTGRAGAEDLQGVADVGEAVLGGDAVAQRSTAGPSTSTVAPQERQTRWWWWVSEHRR